jgi:hypothetical protein
MIESSSLRYFNLQMFALRLNIISNTLGISLTCIIQKYLTKFCSVINPVRVISHIEI